MAKKITTPKPNAPTKGTLVRRASGTKRNATQTVIEIDADNLAFHFYTMIGVDLTTLRYQVKGFTGALFDTNFFTRFKQALKAFVMENPMEGIRPVTVILPDRAVLNDTVKVPNMRSAAKNKKSLETALGGLYRNADDLRFLSYVALQNRQHVTYAVSALQKRIITQIYAACSENGMLVETLTYASASAIGAFSLLNPKQKNASYLFLDIKDTTAHFAFVASGKVTGYYTLPFGLEFLTRPKVTGEDMLFDHAYAELTVLNARERAKSKKLTVMSIDGVAQDVEEDEEEQELPVNEPTDAPADGAEETADAETAEETAAPEAPLRMNAPKLYVRHTARKLPKFMQRPVAETEEDILYENFRIFVKWALTLIASNEKLTELGKPACVFVNFPEALHPVLTRVNAEAAENGVTFTPVTYTMAHAEIRPRLSLFGGFYPKQITAGKF